jgi:hypothetical protein
LVTGEREKMKATTSMSRFADELADYIWLNGLSNREVKSIADSINYRIGFPTFGRKAWLRAQLCCVYASIGTLTLRTAFQDLGCVTESEIEGIVARYVQRLLGLCIAKQLLPEYQQRVQLWLGFFNGSDFSEPLVRLGASFYQFVTGHECDPEYATVLGIRFMRYVPLFLGSIENMAEYFELARN